MADQIDILQWLAPFVTINAAWLVGSTHSERRRVDRWIFLATACLPDCVGDGNPGVIAIVVLQITLATMNLRGNEHG